MSSRPSVRLLSALLLASSLLAGRASAAPAVTVDEFKTFVETQEALADERVQKMPEAQRIPAIAKKNFKMKPEELKAILEKVQGEGGPAVLGEKTQRAVLDALAATALKGRIGSVKVDTGAAHVVTYVVWTVTDAKLVEQEAALVALKAGSAGAITSTFHLTGKDAAGVELFRAKIGADRTSRIKEDRIADWASTRYRKLFEIEVGPTDG